MNIAQLFTLTEHVAVVSGASRGIGYGIALAMSQAGAQVVCASRNEQEITNAAKKITELTGRRAIGVRCDIGQPDDRERLIESAIDSFGKIDVLVNNAGGSGPNNPMQTSAEEFSKTLTWNVVPAFDLTRIAAPRLSESDNGSVINISSAAARYRQKHFSAYGSAKAALSHLTRLLAQDFAPKIRVNGIEPGAIRTEALARFLSPEKEAALIAATPMKSLGSVQDVAATALFLASPAARWITGKVIEVDGGVETPSW